MNQVKRKGLAVPLMLTAGIFLAAAGVQAQSGEDVLLYLTFDENGGQTAADSSGNLPEGEVDYQFEHAAYMEDRDPQWRESGVEGGSLLFDGCSTSVTFDERDLLIGGDSFSVSVWVAPRAFEWDDPKAAENGTEHLTAIVSQYSKDNNQGILLGYQRFGRLCFQVGTGDQWLTLWGEKNLSRYEWNLVTAVFDGQAGSMKLYLDGENVGSLEIDPGTQISPAENENFLVGKNSHAEAIAAGPYNMFSGQMDELKLYDRALTEEEITWSEPPEVVFEDIWLENSLTEDVYKTQYHGGPYEHWMNEPHAPLYYNGMYHLFYQNNMVGTYWRNICWGHLVSEDMVNWKPVKEAITPVENSIVPDGVWSGGAALDVNGVPILFFTAGNDSFADEGLISNQNIGYAVPADLEDPQLLDWVIGEDLAIIQQEGQGRPGEFRDASIWKEGDTWCMLICSGSSETDGGSALLYTTDTLEVKEDHTVDMNWVYKGPVYEMENQSVTFGTSWELPVLLPLTNEAGITKYIFIISPAPAGIADNKIYYFLGDFDLETGKFTPDPEYDNAPRLLDYGTNVFTGPSALRDPVSDKVYLFSIMQDQRSGAEEGASGWAHCVGLTREIRLNAEGTDVEMEPIEALHALEEEVLLDEQNLTLEQANEKLSGITEDMIYLKAVLVPGEDTTEFGLDLKTGASRDRTFYTYDMEKGTITGGTKNKGDGASSNKASGELALKDGKLELEMYVDRSLVEAFFNDTKSLSIRAYGKPESQNLAFTAEGSLNVESLYVARMGSIYD